MYANRAATLVSCSIRYTLDVQFLAHEVDFGLTVIRDARRIIEEIFRRPK